MNAYEIELLNFTSLLDELDSISRFVDDGQDLRKVLAGIIDWNLSGQQGHNALVNKIIGFGSLQERPLYNALYISLVGTFEEFIRKTVEIKINEYSRVSTHSSDIPTALLNFHLRISGKILSTPDDKLPNHITIDKNTIIANLSTIETEGEPVILNPEISYYLGDLLKLETFMEFLGKCGLTLDFDTIGVDGEIQTNLDTTGARQTGVSVKSELKLITRYRNRIAHTGINASDVTKQIFNDHSILLRHISRRVVEVLGN